MLLGGITRPGITRPGIYVILSKIFAGDDPLVFQFSGLKIFHIGLLYLGIVGFRLPLDGGKVVFGVYFKDLKK